MFHRLGQDVMPPALLAGITTLVSLLANANWLGWLGLIVSAGWLVLGFLKHRFEVDRAKGKYDRPRN